MSDEFAPIRDALAAGPTPGKWRADLGVFGGEVFGFSIKAENGTHWHPVAHQSTYQHTNAECYSPAERAANAALIAACNPEAIARLLAALDQAQKDAAYWRWFRANFATNLAAVGLHACETPERLEAHFDAAMKATP